MFLAPEQFEAGVLRQGDIVSNVHVFGGINLSQVQYTVDQDGVMRGWGMPTAPIKGPVAVISHSCELAPENGIKLTSIILAPLRDVSKATKPEMVQTLINSNDLSQLAEDGASFLKYFYVEPHQSLAFTQGSVIDFSKCFSVRNKEYASLASAKIIQMVPEAAQAMALKVALYFHRNQEAR